MRSRLAVSSLVLAWAVVVLTMPASATVLSDYAAALAAGNFVELRNTYGPLGGPANPALTELPFAFQTPGGSCGPNQGDSTEYANHAFWNSFRKRFGFAGASHACASWAFTYYDSLANVWNQGQESVFVDTITHGWDQNAFNPAGDAFVSDGNGRVWKLPASSDSWVAIPSTDTHWGLSNTLAFFPQRNSLWFISGDYGGMEFSFDTNTWTQRFNGKGALFNTSLPYYPGNVAGAAGYTNFSEYSNKDGGYLLFGGGNGCCFFRIDAAGSVTTMPNAPFGDFRVGTGSPCCSLTHDPVSGHLVVIDQLLRIWDFNPSGSGTWTNTGRTAPVQFSVGCCDGGTGSDLISTPIVELGVIMYVKCQASGGNPCWAYLYKHSPGGGGGDTTPPSITITAPTGGTVAGTIPITVTASDNSGTVSGVQFKLDGNNLGSENTASPFSFSWDTTTASNAVHQLTAVARDPSFNSTVSGAVSVTVNNPPGGGSQDFQTRCSQPGVVRCFGFDSDPEMPVTPNSSGYPNNFGVTPGTSTTPSRDTSIKASGASSVRFTVPGLSGSNAGGVFYANVSPDYSVGFGANSTLYIQWRQRFSPEYIAIENFGPAVNGSYTQTAPGVAWKMIDISAMDQVGFSARSCAYNETVFTNQYPQHYMAGYNSCASFAGFYTGSYPPGLPNLSYQNMRPAPYCVYNQVDGQGTCLGYFPNEWMTFKVMLQIGPCVTDQGFPQWFPSHVKYWIGREGQASVLVGDFPNWRLDARYGGGGPVGSDNCPGYPLGKLWVESYMTEKDDRVNHATAYTWYDELIISTQDIADPGADTTPPPPPSEILHVRITR